MFRTSILALSLLGCSSKPADTGKSGDDADTDTDADTDSDTAASSDADGGPPTEDTGISRTEMTFVGSLTLTGTGAIESVVECSIAVWPWSTFSSPETLDHTFGTPLIGEEIIPCPSAIGVAESFSLTLPVEDGDTTSDVGVVAKIVTEMIREQGWEHNPISARGEDTVSDVHISVDISGPPGEDGP